MPKSPSRNSSNVLDEGRVLETLKCQPEILEALDQIKGSKKQQNADFEELAGSLNCTADALKKIWLKRHQEDVKKTKKATETRPRSARSSSIEPRETRRSLRSQSIDKTLVAASTILGDSGDNSCASSSCGSPRPGDKRPHARATRRNLGAINEDNVDNPDVTITPDVTDSGSNSRSKQKEKVNKPKTKGKEKAAEVVEDNSNNADDNESNRDAVNDQQQQQPDGDELADASATALQKFLETKIAENKSRSLRFSEPPVAPPSTQQTPCNSRPSIGANVSRRLSVAAAVAPLVTANEKPTKSSIGVKMPDPEATPTRVFFECMGLTVGRFPPHLQASIKAQVSNLVHETEYDLFSPLTKSLAEKTVAVAS